MTLEGKERIELQKSIWNILTYGIEIETASKKTIEEIAKLIAKDVFKTGVVIDVGDYLDSWKAIDQYGKEWTFSYDSSIRIDDEHPNRVELGTPILTLEEITDPDGNLHKVMERMRKAGCISYGSKDCGVHIHIGFRDINGNQAFTMTALKNLVNIVSSHDDLLADAMRVKDSRLRNWCKKPDEDFVRELNKKKPQKFEDFAKIWYDNAKPETLHGINRKIKYCDSRYHMLNLHSLFGEYRHCHQTIEFRMFQFDEANYDTGKRNGIHWGHLKGYVYLCAGMCSLAITSARTSPKKPQRNNDRFAMRTWLNRLGLIGDDYANAREHLTAKLTGDRAWRDTNVRGFQLGE